jgi:hypothetical protein
VPAPTPTPNGNAVTCCTSCLRYWRTYGIPRAELGGCRSSFKLATAEPSSRSSMDLVSERALRTTWKLQSTLFGCTATSKRRGFLDSVAGSTPTANSIAVMNMEHSLHHYEQTAYPFRSHMHTAAQYLIGHAAQKQTKYIGPVFSQKKKHGTWDSVCTALPWSKQQHVLERRSQSAAPEWPVNCIPWLVRSSHSVL